MLYIVGTPIGNLEDVTFRAIKILKEVAVIFAEDTRITKKLLNHYSIETKIYQYHEHNKHYQIENVLRILNDGNSVALVTDAGTPCISDPGYELVDEVIKNDKKVVAIPGPSALIAAASISGMNMRRFAFEGFLPKKKGRMTLLTKLKEEERTIILYESPYRLKRTLADIEEYLGDRYISIHREITKIYEETIRGKVSDVIDKLAEVEIKGEIVIIIEGKFKKGIDRD